MFRKLSAFLLCIVLALSFTACADKAGGGADGDPSGGNNTPTVTTPGEIDVWTTYGTEKVLRSYKPSDRQPIKLGNTLQVEACQGEYEAGQVIMTATKAVSSFDVKISDLTSGSNTLPASNVELYAEKYIMVAAYTKGSNVYQPPLGDYPDALIPMAGYVASGENKIAEGNNQGVYVSFNVPQGQAPGEYTGKLTITYDGKTKDVDVKLTVYDLEVNEETHSKSYFNVWKTYYIGDLDTSQAMWDQYVQMLVDYRIAPSYVNRDGEKYNNAATDKQTVQAYAEAAAAWVDKGMSTINSPWKAYGAAQKTALTDLIVDLAKIQLDKYIEACEAAQEANPEADLTKVEITTYLDKVIVKGKDEPTYNGTKISDVAQNTTDFYGALEGAVTQLNDMKTALDSEGPNLERYQGYIDGMVNDVNRIPELITEKTPVLGDNNKSGGQDIIDTVCPVFDVYADAAKRNQLDNWSEHNSKIAELGVEKDKWWYGCNTPQSPYPTYHIEDPLVLTRVVDWMMNEYNIVGNLYWAVTSWNPQRSGETYATDDYYEQNAIRNSSSNGEGFLVYPGAPYGVYGPVPSMRLDAIRDGNEDYEILYNLNIKYDELDGLNFREIQPKISNILYSNVQVSDGVNSSVNFDRLRRATIQLGMLANSDAGFCLTDIAKSEKGEKVTAKFTAAEGATIKVNGATEALTGEDYGKAGRKQYTYEFNLDQDDNNLGLVVEVGDEEYAFDFGFGGKVELYSNSALGEGDVKLTADVLDNGGTVTAAEDYANGFKVSLDATTGTLQGFKLRSGKFAPNVQKVVLYIKGSNGSDLQIRVRYTGRASAGEQVFSGSLTTDIQAVEIPITATATQPVDFIYVYTGISSAQNAPAREITISDMVVYYK